MLIPVFEDLIQGMPVSVESFVGKEKMLSVVNNFRYHILRDRLFTRIIADPSGWIVYTGENSLDDFQNTHQFTIEEVKTIKRRLKSFCADLTRKDIRLILLIPPNKNTIYPEYIPAEISPMNSKSRLDQVMSVWDDTDYCHAIDLRGAMQEAKKTSKVFYAIDTHWTDLGAFLAYQQVSQIMREDYPAVKFRPLSDFDQEKKTIISGDLTPTFGHLVVEEEVTVLHPKFESEYLITNIGRSPTNRDIVLTYADNPDLPTAVVYRDSFFTGLIKFVAENFREARYYWSFKPDYNEIYAAKPDYLILEVTERYLKTAIFNLPEPNSE